MHSRFMRNQDIMHSMRLVQFYKVVDLDLDLFQKISKPLIT